MTFSSDTELEKLLASQQEIADKIEEAKKRSIYEHFAGLVEYLQSRNLQFKDFYEIGSEGYKEQHGALPKGIARNVDFKRDGTKRELPIKFKDTIDPSNMWSGRGKQPKWLIARLKEGHKLEEFAVTE